MFGTVPGVDVRLGHPVIGDKVTISARPRNRAFLQPGEVGTVVDVGVDPAGEVWLTVENEDGETNEYCVADLVLSAATGASAGAFRGSRWRPLRAITGDLWQPGRIELVRRRRASCARPDCDHDGCENACRPESRPCANCGKHSCWDGPRCPTGHDCCVCATYLCSDCDFGGLCDWCGNSFCDACRRVEGCDICERYHCEACRDVSWCDECGTSYCEQCRDVSYCDDCGNPYCEECRFVGFCAGCNNRFCEECRDISFCEECEEPFCEECEPEHFDQHAAEASQRDRRPAGSLLPTVASSMREELAEELDT